MGAIAFPRLPDDRSSPRAHGALLQGILALRGLPCFNDPRSGGTGASTQAIG